MKSSSAMNAVLTPVLDGQTVPNLIQALDRAFFPTPTPGFTARMAVLWTLTGL